MIIKELNSIDEKDKINKYFDVCAKKFETENIGDFISPTKQKFIWYFTINKFIHKIELIHQVLTGRREVILDNKELYDSGTNWFSSSNFKYNMYINDCQIQIIELDTYYELYINKKKFSVLYLKELKDKKNKEKENDDFVRENEIDKEFIEYIEDKEKKSKKKLKKEIKNITNIEKTYKTNPFEEEIEDDLLNNLNNTINTPFD